MMFFWKISQPSLTKWRSSKLILISFMYKVNPNVPAWWLVKLFLRSPWRPSRILKEFVYPISGLQTLNTTNYRCHECLNNWGVCVNRKSVSPNRLLNMRSGLESHCEFFQVNNIIQQNRPIILLSCKESIPTITFCVPLHSTPTPGPL